MKISIPIKDTLQGIYADSALTALVAEMPDSAAHYVLSPENESALRQVLRDAATYLVIQATDPSKWRILASYGEAIEFETSDTLAFDTPTATEMLRAALAAVVRHIVFRTVDRDDHQSSLAFATATMRSLSSPPFHLHRLFPCG